MAGWLRGNSFGNPLVSPVADQREEKDPLPALAAPMRMGERRPGQNQFPTVVAQVPCPNHQLGGLEGHDLPGVAMPC